MKSKYLYLHYFQVIIHVNKITNEEICKHSDENITNNKGNLHHLIH